MKYLPEQGSKKMTVSNCSQRIMLVSIFFVFLILSYSTCENHKHRIKRRVIFSKNSKLFFRLNGKVNVIPWVQIFAQGWAVRVNWDLPDTLQRRHKFFKRDLESDVRNLESEHGTKGYSCILNNMCKLVESISRNNNKCGMFCEVGRIIKSSTGVESEFFKSILSSCTTFENTCSANT